ncbi:MAG: complex I subunit 5 family protein [Halanaerobiales bacterium]
MLEVFLGQFSINSFNLIFVATGVIITGVALLSTRDYSYAYRKLFYLCNLIYAVSFTMVIMTNNWIVFIIGWELVTITTFLMLLWGSNKIARIYLIIQFIGSNFLLYVVLMIMSAGYTTIGPISEFNLQVLLILGVGLKSAIIGLHFWLPIVHSRAPSPVSAILSGWVVKLGFIILLKTVTSGNILLFYAGIAMVVYGGIEAVLETDYKVLLAYSTISQLGFIAIGIGSGNVYAYWGSVLHIVVHGLAKTSLFLSSGYWMKKTKSRTIYAFKNGWFVDRMNSILTIIGLTVLAGFPILAGYNCKYLIKYASGDNLILTYTFHGLSILSYLYVFRFLKWGIFNIDKKEKENFKKDEVREANSFLSISIPLLLIIVITFTSNRLLGIKFIDYHIMSGILKNVIYLVIALSILKITNWIYVKEKPVPSMDLFLIRMKNWYNVFKGRPKVKTLEVDMENQIYNFLISFAEFVYNYLPKKIQSQLLIIPIVILLLLLFAIY